MNPASIEMDWFKKWARYAPKTIALEDAESGQTFSYLQLFFISCKLASHFEGKFAIKKGDRVAVMATNELEYIPLYFALQRLGAILVPINFRLTSREISHILGDSQATLAIYQNQFSELFKQVDAQTVPPKTWFFDGPSGLTEFVREHANCPIQQLSSQHESWETEFKPGFEDANMILYTSGTTGAPKGAIITFKMLFWNSVNTTLRLNLNESDITLGFLPFFHTGGWNVLLTPFLHRGAKTVLLKKFEPAQVLELCDSRKVTILFGVPTTMEMMAQTPAFQKCSLSSVRYAIVGGEPMPLPAIEKWQKKGVPIRQGYGLTEFGPNVFSLNEEDSIRKIGSIGFPNFYIDVKVVGDAGQEVKDDGVGELALRGPVCTPGYWNHEKATAETIRDGWLYTGDLVKRDNDGYFYVVGRKKDMYKSGGENVYPVEVEQFLRSHPKVREVAVVGVPDAKWGEVGKAFISTQAGQTLTEAEVLAFCEGRLARFKTPKYVAFLPDLPKGDSGKILKRKLLDGP